MIIDAELDICPGFGWQVEPNFNTLIKVQKSGRERRKPMQDLVKHRYSLPFLNITDAAYLIELKAAFLAARGAAYTFRVKDFADYQAENAVFGVGDGVETEFDLYLPYSFGNATYSRLILYPLSPTFTEDGVSATATFNTTTKKVVFDVAPADMSVIRWTGEFRTLVRFEIDSFPMSIDNRFGNGAYAMNGAVNLLEVWE